MIHHWRSESCTWKGEAYHVRFTFWMCLSNIPEWFTFCWTIHLSCMIDLSMHDSAFHELFIFCRTIHLFMYDSPYHARFTFRCVFHIFLNDSPFAKRFTLHVWFTFSCMNNFWSIIQILLNDSPFRLMIHIFLNDSPFA